MYVKATLDEAFALPVWVSAEIAEIKINYSGHCYLELVEKGGDNGLPLSQARAVICLEDVHILGFNTTGSIEHQDADITILDGTDWQRKSKTIY